MLLLRTVLLLMLLSALVCFALYAGTRDTQWLRRGWLTLKWALIAASGFFAVLILERIA
ncbi:MAG: hypothetical protein OHK0048_03300 [Rhodoferax sp.]